MDQHKNFAYSTVLTAPSPATSGTVLVVASGAGASFPTAPFNCTIWPTGINPTIANAEIVRVTVKSTDTFTITRSQEGSSARTIIVGDQIANTITVKTFTDIELSTPTSNAGDPNGTVDGNVGRPCYDTTNVRNWIKTTASGTLTGWQ